MEEKIIAKNGIPVYSYRSPGTHSFFISMFLRAGSMFETAENNGITHFLEHAVIRNINHKMGGGLYEVLDRYGIEFNASTYSEMVQFFISGAIKNFDIGADIISKALSSLELPASEIEAERVRIKAEIREGDDRTSLSQFASKRVWEGTSLALPITGTAGSVGRIGVRRLEEFRQRSFTDGNIFFYVTGAVGTEELSYLAEKIGEYRISSGACRENKAPIPLRFGRRGADICVKNATFTKVKFSFDIDLSRLSFPECDLLYDISLGADSSRFFVELSEKRGLFYDLGGNLERYDNIGVFSFSYELKEQKLYEALEMTVELLDSFRRELIDENRCMKAGYVDNAEMLLDDPRELNFTLAYENHILGLGYSALEDRKLAYAAITPQQIREAARTVFRTENLTLSIKGNKKRIDTERIKQILAKL